MPERALDEPDGAIVARQRPVALAHVAHQDRVAREVHRVHLGELRVAQQLAPGHHQRRGQRVALGAVAVALGHEARRGGERQAREAAVLGDGVEVGRVGAVAALAQQRLQAELHARVVLALVVLQARVDLEARVLVGHQRAHVVVADGLRRAVQRSRRERVDLGPERAQQRVDVDADVAHAVHRVAEDGHLQRAPARDRGGRPRPVADRLDERVGVPVVGDDVERAPGADHGVGRVLRAVDALVVGQVGHVPLGGDPGDGLDVGQADRQLGVRERARHAHARPVGEHDDEQPVEPLPLEVRDDAIDVVAVAGGRADLDVGDAGQGLAELARVRGLALGDARQHLVVERLHDAQQPDARAARRRLSAVHRRSGSGRRAHRCPLRRAGWGRRAPARGARCARRPRTSPPS